MKTAELQTVLKKCMALSAPLVLLGFVLYKTGCYFETNDDRYIASILSGVITGSPDAHALHVNFLLTFPLALLYRLTTRVPWYGGMLLLFQWVVYASVLESAYSRCRKWFHLISVTVVIGCFFLAYYYMAGLIEFTSTAALLAMAGYTCLLLHDDYKTGLILFFALNLLGYLLRSNAALMVQPLGFSAVLVAMFGEKAEWKVMVRKLLPLTGSFLLIVCLAMVGNVIGYHGEEWKRYKQFNDMRVTFFDYYGAPEYEEVSDILEDYQISRGKYEAFCSYMILNWKVDAECDKRLRSYAVDKGKKDLRIGELWEQIYDRSFADSQWNINRMTIVAWGMFLLWAILRKNWVQMLAGLLFLGGARMAVWLYLTVSGRTPIRVTLPLLACEVMLLLALLWIDSQKADIILWKKAVLILGGLLFCGAGVSSGKQQLRYIWQINGGQEIFMEGLREIREYCQSRPQNRYLLDSGSLSSYAGSILETSVYHPVNAVSSGGWFSNTPAVQQRLEDYLGGGRGLLFSDLCRWKSGRDACIYLPGGGNGRNAEVCGAVGGVPRRGICGILF